MNAQTKLAIGFLNAVYQEDLKSVMEYLEWGASPSWVFNGFPILMHAINLGNEEIVECLLDAGASQQQEAFGFALERGIGECIPSLYYRGIVPKHFEPRPGFGLFPQQYSY